MDQKMPLVQVLDLAEVVTLDYHEVVRRRLAPVARRHRHAQLLLVNPSRTAIEVWDCTEKRAYGTDGAAGPEPLLHLTRQLVVVRDDAMSLAQDLATRSERTLASRNTWQRLTGSGPSALVEVRDLPFEDTATLSLDPAEETRLFEGMNPPERDAIFESLSENHLVTSAVVAKVLGSVEMRARKVLEENARRREEQEAQARRLADEAAEAIMRRCGATTP